MKNGFQLPAKLIVSLSLTFTTIERKMWLLRRSNIELCEEPKIHLKCMFDLFTTANV